MYYNSTNLVNPALKIRAGKNDTQNERVLKLFQEHTELDPSRCYHLFNIYYKHSRFTPITSIRRAITDLTKSGKLTKTGKTVEGLYGEKNNVWRIVTS